MVKQADRYGDIGKRESMLVEICDIVAHKISAVAINTLRAVNVSFVAIKSDIRNARQVVQQSSRPASNIQ